MFFGEFRHQLDDKCRFRIPAKLKEQLGEKPFIMIGPNNSLIVLPHDEAKSMIKYDSSSNLGDSNRNLVMRLMSSSAFYAEEDKQGRIIMPQKLLEHAKFKEKKSDVIQRNIVTIGAFDRVEIWCEQVWDEYSDVDSEEFDETLARALDSKNSNKD